MVPANCPADQKAYVMDQARAKQMAMSPADRPSTLAVAGSNPLPVPSPKKLCDPKNRASGSPRSPLHMCTASPKSRRSSGSSGKIDLGSLTPPNITFAVGTSPLSIAAASGNIILPSIFH